MSNSKNLFLRAYEKALELDATSPELAELIRELDANRMQLIRCIEKVIYDPSIFDFLEVTEEWVVEASELVYDQRHCVK